MSAPPRDWIAEARLLAPLCFCPTYPPPHNDTCLQGRIAAALAAASAEAWAAFDEMNLARAAEVLALMAEREELQRQLAAADAGMLKLADPSKPWRGSVAELAGWQARALSAETQVARLLEVLRDAEQLATFNPSTFSGLLPLLRAALKP